MTLPNTTSPSVITALISIQNLAASLKTQAAQAFMTLQGGSITADWAFNFLDQCKAFIAGLDQYKNVTGLSAFATTQIPGYAGTLTTDLAATRAAVVACASWIVTNFPKDTTNTYILSHVLNADGTRTPRLFTSVETTGLQALLQTLIATIS